MLMGRMLRAMAQATPVRLVSVDGGLKDNAIATAAEAVVCAADVQAASQAAEELDGRWPASMPYRIRI